MCIPHIWAGHCTCMWVLSHAQREGSERWCPGCMYLTPFSSQFPLRIHPMCTDRTWRVCFWSWDFLRCLKEHRCKGTKLSGVLPQAPPLPADGGRSQKREVFCCSLSSLGWASSLFKSAELESNWLEELNDVSPCLAGSGYLCPKAPESLAVIQQRAAACCSDSMGRAVACRGHCHSCTRVDLTLWMHIWTSKNTYASKLFRA